MAELHAQKEQEQQQQQQPQHAPASKPKRCTLTDSERAMLAECTVLLGDVFTPFTTLESAVTELETDPAPQVEIQYWKCMADTLLVYYSTTLRLPKAMETALAAAKAGDGAKSGGGEDAAMGGGLAAEGIGLQGDMSGMQCLKDFDVTPEQRLGIIVAAVPKERRVALLQRLFYLTQAPPDQFEATIALVAERGEAAGREAVVDANLLTTWSALREARAADFEAAEQAARRTLEARRAAGEGGGEGAGGGEQERAPQESGAGGAGTA